MGVNITQTIYLRNQKKEMQNFQFTGMKQVKVCLNLHGIVTVDSATLFEGEEIEVPAAVTIPPPAPIRIIKNLRIVILTRAEDHDILHEVPNAARILNQEHNEDHQIHCSREVPEQQYQWQIETLLINQLPNQGFLLSNIVDVFLLELVVAAVIVSTSAKGVVGRFIEGPARIKRTVNLNKGEEATENDEPVIYEDVSMERGSFLVQQAMRALRAQNLGSAKSRLSLCAEDIRSQIEKVGNTSELCSQLGAVLGMLGDCCRAMGNSSSA
ncbi:hypothetical protein KIW84_051615 [Lathyrus oleraceus]|uniref:Uncharacterized protein n=1 Tax=Pisum sativum TaxID=3888 RepID=A0A9D4WMX7_PEA|nr:hypothetical protein KIW84_051615 [Pisum sativum]